MSYKSFLLMQMNDTKRPLYLLYKLLHQKILREGKI